MDNIARKKCNFTRDKKNDVRRRKSKTRKSYFERGKKIVTLWEKIAVLRWSNRNVNPLDLYKRLCWDDDATQRVCLFSYCLYPDKRIGKDISFQGLSTYSMPDEFGGAWPTRQQCRSHGRRELFIQKSHKTFLSLLRHKCTKQVGVIIRKKTKSTSSWEPPTHTQKKVGILPKKN